MDHVICRLGAVIVGVMSCLGMAAGAQPPSLPPAQAIQQSTPPAELVAKVVERELRATGGGHFMYREWHQAADGVKVKEVIETGAGDVARLIAINDQPLTPPQRAEEDARLQNLVRHPELQKQKKKEQRQDDEQVSKMFRELPKAFLYDYEGVEQGQSGELIRLKFVPNPRYQPPSREISVYKAMSGKLWVAVPEYRLARIEATLFRDMHFGWGILGHLDKGGHFCIEQSKITPTRWDVTYQNIQFNGKVLLFKNISQHEVGRLSDYRRVPDNLTLAQGIEMLKKNSGQMAANHNQDESR
jgi:hypothetical protein